MPTFFMKNALDIFQWIENITLNSRYAAHTLAGSLALKPASLLAMAIAVLSVPWA
ncbi:MAG: hypothetical protein HRU20_30835 [Pseudomonadales bacterium]|nr:hypothetical protein [Pseudomonadales bacterium]